MAFEAGGDLGLLVRKLKAQVAEKELERKKLEAEVAETREASRKEALATANARANKADQNRAERSLPLWKRQEVQALLHEKVTEPGAMTFDLHIGIDYSGRETPTSRTPGLQVYAASGDEEPRAVRSPKAPHGANWNWCRKEIAEWLIEQARSKATFIAGIDHGFSFPISYFEKYKLKTWEGFLDDFCRHWPTDGDHTYVEFIREKGPDRIGSGYGVAADGEVDFLGEVGVPV